MLMLLWVEKILGSCNILTGTEMIDLRGDRGWQTERLFGWQGKCICVYV